MPSVLDKDFLKTVTDADKRMAIIKAVAEHDVPGSDAWQRLALLSSQTEFEEIDAVPEGIFEHRADDFEAVATVYVTLHYGETEDRRAMSDAYPAHVRGDYDSQTGTARITALTVDTATAES